VHTLATLALHTPSDNVSSAIGYKCGANDQRVAEEVDVSWTGTLMAQKA
jgi:hypothetical protein